MKLFYLSLFFLFFLTTSAAAVVNINTGSLDDLTSLAGIGQVKAESIIKYRQDNGPFKKVEDLKRVYGIGAKMVARLKGEITVGEPKPVSAETAVESQQAGEQEATAPPAKQ